MIPATAAEAKLYDTAFKKFFAQAALTNGTGSIVLPTVFPDGSVVPANAMLCLQGTVAFNYDLLAAIVASVTQASVTFTIATGSGVLVATVGGFSASVTWATSDSATATALAAAMNAVPGIAALGTAAPSAGTVVFTASAVGTGGNGIATTATGTGFTVNHTATQGGAGNPGIQVASETKELVLKTAAQVKVFFSAGGSGSLNIFCCLL